MGLPVLLEEMYSILILNVKNRPEAALFPEKEYINEIAVAVKCMYVTLRRV